MLELAFKAHGQIVDFWKFFVPSALVLLGWIFTRKDPWPWGQRVAVAIGYLGFAAFNLYGLVESYGMLETLVAELRATKAVPGLTDKSFDAVVSRLDMGSGWKVGIAFHIVFDLIVLYFILLWAGRKHAP
ncbi:MAG TPA: hypothetical protein PKV98_17465 [Burkholderiaceae bacterium]|nr:hypothetical protein [Burkholderiaceae bacterium]